MSGDDHLVEEFPARREVHEIGSKPVDTQQGRTLVCVVAREAHGSKAYIRADRSHLLGVALDAALGDVEVAAGEGLGPFLIRSERVGEDGCVAIDRVEDREDSGHQEGKQPHQRDTSHEPPPRCVTRRALEFEVEHRRGGRFGEFLIR